MATRDDEREGSALSRPGREVRLIGRSRALAAAERLVVRLLDGRGACLAVLGEPGVGKTRLAMEVLQRARRAGVSRVVATRCLPLTVTPAFDPVLDLLRRLQGLDARLSRRLPSPGDVDVFERTADAITEAAGEATLLIVDDVHWSDRATLDLIHYCTARLVDVPVGWVLAGRPTAMVTGVVLDLEHGGSAERIELHPFTRSELAEAMAEMLGAAPDEALVDAVYARTDGNPFLCEHLVRAAAGGSEPDPDAVARRIPPSVVEMVRTEVGRLSPGAWTVAGWCSVFSEPLRQEWLEQVTPDADIEPELARLGEAGILEWVADRGWGFSHALLRDAVYATLDVHERRRRHSRAADVIGASEAALRAPQLERAERWDEAAEAFHALADEALLVGAGADAAEFATRAEELARRAGRTALVAAASARRVLGDLRRGEVAAAVGRAEELIAAQHGSADTESFLWFLTRYALALWDETSDLDAARAAVARAEPLMTAAGGALLVESALAQATIRGFGGDPSGGRRFAARALAEARRIGDTALEARAQTRLGLLVGETSGAREGIAILEQAAAAASAAGLDAELALADLNLAYLWQAAGDEELFAEYTRRGLAVEHLPAGLEVMLRGNLGVAHATAGDMDAALAAVLAAQAAAGRLGDRTEARVVVQRLYIHVLRGDLEAAQHLVDQTRFAAEGFERARACEPVGMLLEEQGRLEEALDAYRSGAEAADHPVVPWCLAGAIRCAVALGRPEDADACLERLAVRAERWPATRWLLAESRGRLLSMRGETARAIVELRQAAELCTEAYPAARIRLEAAVLSGDRAGVIGAIVRFDEMGARHAAAQARRRARALGIRPPSRPPEQGVLTPRERQVAHLAAAGRTNPEIAQELYLSPRTVERHITHILAKLDLRSRVQLAAHAAGGHLPA